MFETKAYYDLWQNRVELGCVRLRTEDTIARSLSCCVEMPEYNTIEPFIHPLRRENCMTFVAIPLSRLYLQEGLVCTL